MHPLVSFIIPMYKGKNYIEKCVSSLLDIHLYKEIIIIDDGSPDDSLIYCEQLYKSTPEVFIYSKTNGGIASARNYGLDIASGTYIVFIDQDDIVNPGVIELAINIIIREQVQILFWDTESVFDSGETVKNTYSSKESIIDRKEIIYSILPNFLLETKKDTEFEIGSIWGCVFDLKFIRNNNLIFKHFVSYEDDHLFLFDALLCAQKIYFLPETGYYWFIRKDSTSHKHLIIDNYVTRYLNSYKYRYNHYKMVCDDNDLLYKCKTYIKQKVIIYSISKVCTYYNWDMKGINIIRELLYKNNYLDAFTNCELVIDTNYAKLIYPLIRKKMEWVAFIVSYLNSIRNQLNNN